jgi:hypothetical protein
MNGKTFSLYVKNGTVAVYHVAKETVSRSENYVIIPRDAFCFFLLSTSKEVCLVDLFKD